MANEMAPTLQSANRREDAPFAAGRPQPTDATLQPMAQSAAINTENTATGPALKEIANSEPNPKPNPTPIENDSTIAEIPFAETYALDLAVTVSVSQPPPSNAEHQPMGEQENAAGHPETGGKSVPIREDSQQAAPIEQFTTASPGPGNVHVAMETDAKQPQAVEDSLGGKGSTTQNQLDISTASNQGADPKPSMRTDLITICVYLSIACSRLYVCVSLLRRRHTP